MVVRNFGIDTILNYAYLNSCWAGRCTRCLRIHISSLPLSAEDRTFAMIDSLSYVNAVVMEGLRLVNTISSYQTRVVPKGGCVVADHYLPAGVSISPPFLSCDRICSEINIEPDHRRRSALPHQPPAKYLSKSQYIRPISLASSWRGISESLKEYVDILQRAPKLSGQRAIISK